MCICSTGFDAVKLFLKKFTIIHLIKIYWLLKTKEFFLGSQKFDFLSSANEVTTYAIKAVVKAYIMRNSDFYAGIFSLSQIIVELLSFDSANYTRTEFNLIKQIFIEHLLFHKALLRSKQR